jgi:3-methyladenine DNA glycosylase AlkD
MTEREVLRQLQKMGTVQNRKVYARHGVGPNMYGVSYADLGKLRKKIKTDHDLALKLWASGNHDARVLATMIADPDRATASLLNAWANDLSNYVLTDAFVNYASTTRLATKRMEQYTRSNDEWKGRAGWMLLAKLAMEDAPQADRFFEQYLATIEREIHTRKNRVRDAMNSALIAIGIRNPALQKRALRAAAKIGKVKVDHGETSCRTPDAAVYIRKAAQRRRAKA